MANIMKDFFVSYTGSDQKYATWIAKILESSDSKYSVTIQAWDFLPGDNFVSKINSALIECDKLIVVLSKRYLDSEWCKAEWTAKYTEQINEGTRKIIPIRIEGITVKGLLANISYIDIVDKDEETAKKLILDGVKDKVERIDFGYQSFFSTEHLQIDIDYYVYSDKIVYIKHCKSKVLTTGKNSIHQRITWFVDEEVKLESLTDGVEIQVLDLHDTNLNYNIVFDHILDPNEEVEYCIKATLTNKNHHFKNFFSTEVITPIHNLSVTLNLVDSTVQHVYTQKICKSIMNKRTEEPKKNTYIPPFHWHIDSPELNFEYMIYW